MESKLKILVVEDEMLIGAKIPLFLTELGYEVNLAHVDEVAEGHVVIGTKQLPLSQSLREGFLRRFRMV